MRIQAIQNNTQNNKQHNKQNVHFKQITTSASVLEKYGQDFVDALKSHPMAKEVNMHFEAPLGSFNMTGGKTGWFKPKVDHEPLSVGEPGAPGYIDVSKKENVTVAKVVNRIKQLLNITKFKYEIEAEKAAEKAK